ncbi:hypothetical protein N7510_009383 [Penicillium lagena]|uniref:uncharacterized protein n=1 Tax=Penicillium lagena TaxID=94218 RepID=UPI002540E8CA|nr:uncharacterized protein N7510_009383 [Penicillium lagena]KAJ5606602.1 hypothetical protein N7510_009383 [Penicillium lagena]
MSQLQFIEIPHPADLQSQRRAVYSHAARVTHSRRRARSGEKKKKEDGGSTVSSVGPISLLSAARRDPFASFVAPFQPVEDFLLDHYVRAVVPRLRCMENPIDYSERMTTAWVPLALGNASLLNGLFLAACRDISESYGLAEQQQRFLNLAMQYKLGCVRALQEKISRQMPPFSDSTVATVVMLAFDELFLHDARMSRQHIGGAVKMVSLNGGPQNLGLNGFLEHLLSNLLQKMVGKARNPRTWDHLVNAFWVNESLVNLDID